MLQSSRFYVDGKLPVRIKLFEQASVLSRALFFFALVTVVFVALYPNLKLPPMIIGIRLSDEFYHILAFTTLTFIALQVWQPSLPLMLLLVFFALGLELAQVAIPGRGVELSDVVASLSGVALGGMVSSAPRRLRRAFRRGTGTFKGPAEPAHASPNHAKDPRHL